MKVTFFSNFLNHHQLPFCKEMYDRLGDEFKFIATEPINKERLDLGYEDMSRLYPFCINAYESIKSHQEAIKLGDISDVVIIGSAPEEYISKRLQDNKLTFRYSERIFKKGRWRIINPRIIRNLYLKHTKYSKKNLYMLCASAYTASDLAMVGAYRNKTYKWGYFPEVKQYNIEQLIQSKQNNPLKLLWVGRYLRWKHPEKALFVAKELKKDGYKFTLDMIGTGEEEEQIRNKIKKYNLDKEVNLIASMSPNKVREYMEKASIYLFTSDYNEGWGAVLNEAMNSGCAVVASNAIGSVPFLLEHNVNGLVYRCNSSRDLYKQVRILMEDELLRHRLGKKAYATLNNIWNAEKAVENLINLSNNLLGGKQVNIKEGPGSIDKK